MFVGANTFKLDPPRLRLSIGNSIRAMELLDILICPFNILGNHWNQTQQISFVLTR